MQTKEYTLPIGEQTLTVQFTDLAEQANGSVLIRLGNTVILATATMSEESRDNLGYFPLTVDYEERFYAAGQILGSRFMRREGRPSDEAVLSGRIVDRTIRPLFDKHIRNDVHVVITILSIENDDPDTLAVLGASLALATSDIPWNGPVSAVRIAKQVGSDAFIINPSYAIRGDIKTEFDLIACGKDGNINMIEVGAQETPETTVAQAFQHAVTELERLQEFQKMIVREMGKTKRIFPDQEIGPELVSLFKERIASKLYDYVFKGPGKAGIHELGKEWQLLVKEQFPETSPVLATDYYDEAVNSLLHQEAIDNKRRPDGRELSELRPLFAQAGGISPVLHGSGIFYRGGTHILSALTLGGPQDSLIIDGMEIQTKKNFIHHYNFPPFSSGETGRIGGFNRRMIGHGALAEKALAPVIPSKEVFPYTIRIVSEALASNGSTSMGSVCGSTLALMDAGVPISTPVAGIASGIMYENPERYALLTDIQGPEDEHGDMDFKVAGTENGVTAIQMDVKVDGIPVPILIEALDRAREARIKILAVLKEAIPAPRPEISPRAPRIVQTKIKPSQIGMVIGSGGKVINEIRELTQTEIEIEDDGMVYITGKGDGPQKAKMIIEDMTREYAVGERLVGTITRLADFGAFVRLGSNAEGLVHVSEIAPFRVAHVKDVLKPGQEVPVVVKEFLGPNKISLSIKEADPNFIKTPTRDDFKDSPTK